MKHKRSVGTQQRPDFVLIDDPQTDESASTPLQVSKRLNVIKKSILKLGGHTRKIAVVMNATVIRPDDLVEQLLDPKRNPAWQGERIKMVKRWSDAHETLWMGDYQRLRNTYDQENVDDQRRAHREATEFYRRNREAMDKGCIVSWQHCFDPETEISAIQHAYNFLIDDGPDVFASECQNEPLVEKIGEDIIDARKIVSKAINLQRGVVPMGCNHLTAYIDVQGKLLYYVVCAFGEGFTGHVVDYGTYPDQKGRNYFTLKDAKRTLAHVFPKGGMESQLYAGMEALKQEIASRVWRREDGAEMRLARGMIDANWGDSTDIVYQSCRTGCFSNIFMPSHGKFVGAGSMPWEQYTRKDGELLGNHWMMPSIKAKRAVRHILIDTNYWKTFVHARLKVPVGDKGCLSLFAPTDRDTHRMFADHVGASEYAVKTEGRGRTVIEWKTKPNKPDNHWFDCLTGCHVAASMLGVSAEVGGALKRTVAKKRPRVSYI
jgi:phage terminase large subunit GpA-like protein